MTRELTLRVRELHLDRARVLRAKQRMQRRVLTRVGGSIRLTAKRSIRKRKRISEPGKPPSSHAGHLRRGLRCAYDQRTESVVIGPTNNGNPSALESLEYGGRTTIRIKSRRGGPARRKRVRIEARPSMVPAYEKTKERIPQGFRDAFGR